MEILNFQEELPGGKVLAMFEVYIPALQMTLRKVKLMKGKNKAYIALPAYAVGEGEARVWHQYVSFSKEKGDEFNRKVLEALEPFMRKG